MSGDDEQQFTEFYQNKELMAVLELTLEQFQRFTPFTLALVISLVTELINKDPSPPTILNFLLSSTNLVSRGLTVFDDEGKKAISLDDDLPVVILLFLSAISITKDVLAMAGIASD